VPILRSDTDARTGRQPKGYVARLTDNWTWRFPTSSFSAIALRRFRGQLDAKLLQQGENERLHFLPRERWRFPHNRPPPPNHCALDTPHADDCRIDWGTFTGDHTSAAVEEFVVQGLPYVKYPDLRIFELLDQVEPLPLTTGNLMGAANLDRDGISHQAAGFS
jgi:hypothetical protein